MSCSGIIDALDLAPCGFQCRVKDPVNRSIWLNDLARLLGGLGVELDSDMHVISLDNADHNNNRSSMTFPSSTSMIAVLG